VSTHFVAFETSLFAGAKICIPVADILSVCEVNQALIFPNAIKIFVKLHAGDMPNNSTGDSSYFFGSFAPGEKRSAFQLINSLCNGTFDADEWRMNTPTPTSAASSSAPSSVSSPLSPTGTSLSSIEDDSDEDDDDEQSAEAVDGADKPSISRMATHLDFGEHRPPSADVKGEEEMKMQDMCEMEFPGITAKAFFRLFLSDAALFSHEMYHKIRGDSEYQASGQ
jgi:hypothetical protein